MQWQSLLKTDRFPFTKGITGSSRHGGLLQKILIVIIVLKLQSLTEKKYR